MEKPRLYTAAFCQKCKEIKKYLESTDIEYEIKDLDIEEIKKEALALGVRNIPILITFDGVRYIGDKIREYK